MRSLHVLFGVNCINGRSARRPRGVAQHRGRGTMRRGPDRGRSRQMRAFAAAALGVLLTLTACGGGSGGSKTSDDSLPITVPNVATTDPVRDGGPVTMALEKD